MAAGLKAVSENKLQAKFEVTAKSSATLSEAERKRRLRFVELTYPQGRAGMSSDQRAEEVLVSDG